MKAVILDNKVINVGEWENGELPEGAVEGDFDIIQITTGKFVLASDWKELRINAYSLLNQLEMQYNDLINTTTTWKDAISEIKVKYPKE